MSPAGIGLPLRRHRAAKVPATGQRCGAAAFNAFGKIVEAPTMRYFPGLDDLGLDAVHEGVRLMFAHTKIKSRRALS